MSEVLERFLRYVKVDTRSEEGVQDRYPSTDKQKVLLEMLVEELKEIGIADAMMDEYGYVTATIPSNLGSDRKHVITVGLIAHVDTSPEVSGSDVTPILHRDYDGGDIQLPSGTVIRAEENPHLRENIGNTIVTSDGSTLLGADDKAGVAEIMTAASMLMKDASIPHGRIRIAFTPDEEVGNGTKFFDVKKFDADCAYTIDGGVIGEVEDETFNAMTATFKVRGINVHPGYAKGKMVNAVRIIAEIASMLPPTMSPEATQDREGYLHPNQIEGAVEEASLKVLIRDFTMEGIGELVNVLENVADLQGAKYPGAEINLDIQESYRNMKEVLDQHPEVTTIAVEAVRRAGVEPRKAIVRGGTDGSRLSFMGLPTPNLFAGGMNFHSRQEYVPLRSMEAAVMTIIELVKLHAGSP